MEPHPTVPPVVAPRPSPTRAPSIRYMGFECTKDGRAYRLRVEGTGEARLVTITIPTAAFASRKARFQDAPELCYARLQRQLTDDPAFEDGLELVLTLEEMDAYREAQQSRSPDRKARALRAWP